MAHLVVLPSVVVSSWAKEENCDDSFRCMGANGVLLVGIPSLDVDVSLNPLLVVAGYSLEYSSRLVHLSESETMQRVCGVWDFLIHASEADVLRIPSEVQHVDDLPAQRYGQEIKWLVGWWLSPRRSRRTIYESLWVGW